MLPCSRRSATSSPCPATSRPRVRRQAGGAARQGGRRRPCAAAMHSRHHPSILPLPLPACSQAHPRQSQRVSLCSRVVQAARGGGQGGASVGPPAVPVLRLRSSPSLLPPPCAQTPPGGPTTSSRSGWVRPSGSPALAAVPPTAARRRRAPAYLPAARTAFTRRRPLHGVPIPHKQTRDLKEIFDFFNEQSAAAASPAAHAAIAARNQWPEGEVGSAGGSELHGPLYAGARLGAGEGALHALQATLFVATPCFTGALPGRHGGLLWRGLPRVLQAAGGLLLRPGHPPGLPAPPVRREGGGLVPS